MDFEGYQVKIFADRIHLILLNENVVPTKRIREICSDCNVDLEEVIELNPKLFWLGKIAESNWEIRAKLDIKLCNLYLSGVCNGRCGLLHFCKNFLFAKNYCSPNSCKNGFSHSLDDLHNKSLLHHSITNLCAVRASFPRLCTSFVERGECRKEFCGYLHICPDYIHGKCSDTCILSKMTGLQKCELHNFSIDHNKMVLKNFDLSILKKDRQILLTNILLPKSNIDKVCEAYSSNETNLSLNGTIVLCTYYLNGTCKNDNCPSLHLCKEFLINFNKCPSDPCQFGFSHDPMDGHNKTIMQRNDLFHLPHSHIMKALRESFPRVCKEYLKDSGCNKMGCNRLHICHCFLQEICSSKCCTFSHNFEEEHNLNILEKFGLEHLIDNRNKQNVDYIRTNILFPTVGKVNRKLPATPNKLEPVDSKVAFKLDMKLDQPSKILFGSTSITGETKSKRKQTSEEEVINYILDNFENSECTMNDYGLLVFFDNDVQKAKKWFTEHIYTFRVVSKKSGVETVHVCVEELMPCFFYWRTKGICERNNCKLFHICREILIDVGHNKRRCKLVHDLFDKHNREVIKCLGFSSMSEDRHLSVLKKRLPTVCLDNLNQSCKEGEDFCSSLHICAEFLKGKCKKAEALCNLKHESALEGTQATRLQNEFRLQKHKFRSCILVPTVIKNEKVKNTCTLKETFDYVKDEAICHLYLTGDCGDSFCRLLHPNGKLPYLWQYRNCGEDFWYPFLANDNKELEKLFCNVNVNTIGGSSIKTLVCSNLAVLNVDSSNYYEGNNVTLRRLSTKSSVHGEIDDRGLTEWKWYWQKTYNEFVEYEGLTTSESIEKAYHSGKPSFQFDTDEFTYIISFDNMVQTNQDERYGTKRPIRRRPVYKTRNDISRRESTSALLIPNHWPKTHTIGERISINASKYNEIKDVFELSIGRQVEVISIMEICNDEHHDKYERKKTELKRKLSAINEKLLYHGTDHATVDAICAQNFDWRLCGKNATKYGQGSYFSTSAAYSHRYTSSNNSGIRFMFISTVLAGRYVTGKSSYKRPPELDLNNIELYDSCVDKLSDPSIYVVFERDQCYPKYLISYVDEYNYSDTLAYIGSKLSLQKSHSNVYSSHRAASTRSYTRSLPPSSAGQISSNQSYSGSTLTQNSVSIHRNNITLPSHSATAGSRSSSSGLSSSHSTYSSTSNQSGSSSQWSSVRVPRNSSITYPHDYTGMGTKTSSAHNTSTKEESSCVIS